jgi:virginiamycin B lyase
LSLAAVPAIAQPLAGRVTSAREGAMEGVVVSAAREGSPVTISVVTDAEGRYAFPANRLTPGTYRLDIRAAGYEMPQQVRLAIGGQTSQVDISLRPTNDLAIQLTNAEWMDSIPVPYADKHFLRNCTNCHRLTLPLMSTHTADEFVDVQQRMTTYAAASSPLLPQKLLRDRVANLGELALERRANVIRQQAVFLAQVNLNEREVWAYPLQPRPRATGRATRVVITEYDLPQQTRMPHDVILTPDGTVWYNSFAEQILGRLDPATGAVKEYVVPTLKPNAPLGGLALRPDAEGQVWMGLAYQAGVARFDPKTESFRMYPLPAPQNQDHTQTTEVEPRHMHVDGKVWIEDSGTYSIYRMDVKTGAIEVFQPFPIPSPNVYDITTDEQNNVYFTVFGRGDIGRVDAKTGEIRIWPTPTKMSSPRRGTLDVKTGRFWFGEFAGDRIGMFDTKTETFREFPPPSPFTFPYDALADRNGEVWSGNMNTDRVQRLNPETGVYVEYPLPRSTNIRRVSVDNSTTPVTFWAGSNHGASIVRVEPLD